MSTTVLERPLEEIVAENIRTESARRGFSQSAIAHEYNGFRASA
nr:MAG TPA: Regulatory protein [Caudoviricetes sp.]